MITCSMRKRSTYCLFYYTSASFQLSLLLKFETNCNVYCVNCGLKQHNCSDVWLPLWILVPEGYSAKIAFFPLKKFHFTNHYIGMFKPLNERLHDISSTALFLYVSRCCDRIKTGFVIESDNPEHVDGWLSDPQLWLQQRHLLQHATEDAGQTLVRNRNICTRDHSICNCKKFPTVFQSFFIAHFTCPTRPVVLTVLYHN